MAGYTKESSVNLLARFDALDNDTNSVIEISDPDFENPVMIQSSEEEVLSNMSEQGQRINSFWMILAIVTNCVQGQFFALTQPAAQVGTLGTLLSTLVIGIVFTYTASLAVKYLRPNDNTLADEIMIEIWPKIKWPLTILTRATSFLLYFCYLVQAYIYVYDGIATWGFKYNANNLPQASVKTLWISFVLMFLISFITNVRISVLLCSWTAFIPLLSLTITVYVVVTQSKSEDYECWRQSWGMPSGEFQNGIKSGINALFSFLGVLESCFFEHYSLGTQLAEAKTPKHNRRNVSIAFYINIACYIFYCLISTIPYGCYMTKGTANYPAPPSDFSVLFGQSTFGIVIGVIYVCGTIVGAPYTFLICRMSSIDLLPWRKYPQLKKYRRVVVYLFHLALCLLAVLCQSNNLSLQLINEIGAAFSSLLFAAIVPIILDVYMCHVNRKPYAWRVAIGAPVICCVGCLSVFQFISF